jgi:hypothetical protein
MPAGIPGRGTRVAAGTNQGTAAQPLYHRLESPTQTPVHATKQVYSRELWGRPHGFGGTTPSAKAYPGPLPLGRRGIEFTTPVAPTHRTPSVVYWMYGYHPGILLRRVGPDDVAVIPITVTQNTQVP